jgi:hypothetical protein
MFVAAGLRDLQYSANRLTGLTAPTLCARLLTLAQLAASN